MNEILLIVKRRFIPILSAALFAVMFIGYGASARAAGTYSAEEKIYLKAVTPILFEYSQVASQVSANVLPLQSAPAEKCSSQFSYYYGIMSSLSKHLGTITPPARFESVQANSASAISDYETSLNLYSAACTQEDFGTKEELVSRAGAGVNRSVSTIGTVYREIEDLGAVAAAPPAASNPDSENLSESAIETAPSGEAVEDVYVEEQAEAATPPAPTAPPAPKTREEVIQNLAEEVDTGGAPETAQTGKTAQAAPAAPVVEALKPAAPPAVKAPEPVKLAPPAPVEAPAETTKIEAPKPAAPPAVKAPEPVKPAPSAPVEAPAETAKIETPEAAAPAPEPVEPPPVETKELPEPEIPAAAEVKPAPAPAPAVETAAVPAPAAPEKPAPAPEVELPPATQEGAQSAKAGPQPLEAEGAPSEAVTEKSMDAAALAPGMTEEELKEEALPEDEINSWCSKFQTDFERAACVKKRTEARDKAEVLSTSFEDGTPEKEIVEKCRADWKEGVTYNYEMVVSCTQFFCTQKGLEACKELSK